MNPQWKSGYRQVNKHDQNIVDIEIDTGRVQRWISRLNMVLMSYRLAKVTKVFKNTFSGRKGHALDPKYQLPEPKNTV